MPAPAINTDTDTDTPTQSKSLANPLDADPAIHRLIKAEAERHVAASGLALSR